jgi:hypothetical protein
MVVDNTGLSWLRLSSIQQIHGQLWWASWLGQCSEFLEQEGWGGGKVWVKREVLFHPLLLFPLCLRVKESGRNEEERGATGVGMST